jgi:hypothetical protein
MAFSSAMVWCLYLSIFSPARPEPGPPMDLTGRVWATILQPAKKILARAQPEMLFLAILHYKNMGGPPEPGPGPKNLGFFGPAREMLRYSGVVGKER